MAGRGRFEAARALGYEHLPQLTGFETAEIDLVLDSPAAPAVKDDPAAAVPELAATAITRVGDLWLMDEHRTLCGDAQDPAASRASSRT